MKKKNFYALLCTTIILPGAILGADEQAVGTPARVAKLRQDIDAAAPTTPDLRTQQTAIYSSNTLTPDTRSFYVEVGTDAARRKRDEEKQQKLEKAIIDDSQKKLQVALKAEEDKGNREKLEHEALIQRAQEASRQKQAENQALDKRVDDLTAEVSKLTLKLQSRDELKKFSAEQIASMSKELRDKSAQLADAKQKLLESAQEAKLLAQRAAHAEAEERKLEAGLQHIIDERAGGAAQQRAEPVVVAPRDPLPNVADAAKPKGVPQDAPPAAAVKAKKVVPGAKFGDDA